MSAPAPDRSELVAIYDNPATSRREVWIDGRLARFVAIGALERPECRRELGGSFGVRFEPGRLQGSAAALGAAALEQVGVAAVATQLRAAEIAAAALRRALLGAERQLRELAGLPPATGMIAGTYLRAAELVAAEARRGQTAPEVPPAVDAATIIEAAGPRKHALALRAQLVFRAERARREAEEAGGDGFPGRVSHALGRAEAYDDAVRQAEAWLDLPRGAPGAVDEADLATRPAAQTAPATPPGGAGAAGATLAAPAPPAPLSGPETGPGVAGVGGKSGGDARGSA